MKYAFLQASGLAVFALVGAAQGQGADNCAQAQVITGLGTFAFDNTAATIDGPADCEGTTPVRKDVWFAWTAPSTGGFVFSTCGIATLDTRLAVYEGVACPPTLAFGCVQQVCGTQARLPFPAQQGVTYLLRLGNRLVGAGATGVFEVSADACSAMPDDAFEPNDSCAAATCVTSGTSTGLFVAKSDPDWYAFEVASGAMLQVDLLFTHMNGDIDTYLFDACGGTQLAQGATGTNNERVVWTNTTGADRRVVLRVEHFLPDPRGDCATYDMVVAGAGPCGPSGQIGVSFCATSPNSAGSGALISATGSTLASDRNITLRTTGGPDNATGLFYFGSGRLQVPFGQGMRCASNPSLRVQPPAGTGPANGNPAGEALRSLDFNAPYAAALVAGNTITVQYWYLDGTNVNLSDGLEIVLQ